MSIYSALKNYFGKNFIRKLTSKSDDKFIFQTFTPCDYQIHLSEELIFEQLIIHPVNK